MTPEQIEAISADPKAVLLNGRNTKARISAMQERISFWQQLAESITVTPKADGGTGPNLYKQSLIENAVCSIVDIENEITEGIIALAAAEMTVREAINLFVRDNRFSVVLEMRYLNGYSWGRIAAELYYSKDWVCRLHGMALAEMKANAENYLKKT